MQIPSILSFGNVVTLCLIALPCVCPAAALIINESESSFELRLRLRVTEGGEPMQDRSVYYTNNVLSPIPVANTLSNTHTFVSTDGLRTEGYALSMGKADWFSAAVLTSERYWAGNAYSLAISTTAFSSPVDQIVYFGLQGSRSGVLIANQGFVSLVDVTASRPLWFHFWGFGNSDQISGDGNELPEAHLMYDYVNKLSFSQSEPADILQPTELRKDHNYRLVMYLQSNAYGDGSEAALSVIVPEPSVATLLGLALLGLLPRTRQRCVA